VKLGASWRIRVARIGILRVPPGSAHGYQYQNLVTRSGVIAMAGVWKIRRSRGILAGTLVALLGIWGGLIPFVGPYFNYAYTPDTAWTYTTGRLWLEILPGGAALLGGLLLVIAGSRHLALSGAFLGIVAGAWFALGNVVAPLWTTAAPAGVPASTATLMRVVEQIGFFTGLGVAMVLIAATAAGRLSAVPGVPVTPLKPVTTAEPVTEPVGATAAEEPASTPAGAGEETRSFRWRRLVP
jgi:hypothetical protein